MELRDKVAVVTGGATGIGRALCRRFARDGARVVVADIDEAGASEVAESITGLAVRTDVSREEDVVQLVAQATERYGQDDLFCSNAGIALDGGPEASDDALDPDRVADIVVAGLRAECFLILPHPEVLEYFRRKSDDYDRWIRGMRRLNEKVKAIIADADEAH